MSHDILVFARKSKPMPIDQVLERLHQRQIPVEWSADAFAEAFRNPSRSGGWVAGTMSLPNREGAVTMSHEKLKRTAAKGVVSAYKDSLDAAKEEALLRATLLYRLSAGDLPMAPRERLLAGIAEVVAEMTDGLILDTQTNQVYDLSEYRALPH
jgi:hypothetical protein